MPFKQASLYGAGSPLLGASPIQRDYMLDPRRQLMAELMKQGTSTAPVQSPLEGLSRALTAGLGGYFGAQARQEMQDREKALGSDMARVLAGGQARPWVDPDTGKTSTAPAGGLPGMLASGAAIQNPDLTPFMQQISMADVASKEAAQQKAEERAWKAKQPIKMGAGDIMYNPETGEADFTAPSVPSSSRYMAIPTNQGMMLFDKVTGELSPLSAGATGATTGASGAPVAGQPPSGKPLLPANLDPGISGDVARAKGAGKVEGESAAKAAIDLPKVMDQANYSIKLLDDIISHPGMSTVVGAPGITGIPAKLGVPIPGTDAADFMTRLEQIKGGQFLQAYETLKGSGQITEIEGVKASNAIARMSTAQSEKEFIAAAKEYQDIIRAGLRRAAENATVGRQQPEQMPAVEYDFVPGQGLVKK